MNPFSLFSAVKPATAIKAAIAALNVGAAAAASLIPSPEQASSNSSANTKPFTPYGP